MTDTPERCSDSARERVDPMVGTASPSRRWLLIEHPGPWAVAALDSPGIPAARQALQAAVVAGAGRVQLIRRPGRQSSDGPYLWVVLDHDTGRRASGTWRQGPEDTPDAGLLEAAQALAATAPAPGAGQPPDDPLLLVCAHGRHDVCCAVRGRPVAAALAQRWPDLTWECSHVGGDRFAANLVVVPDGVYYGQLDAVSAVDVVAAHLAGRVDVEHLRGFTTVPAAAQAAMTEAHRRWGPAGPRGFVPTSVTPTDDGRWNVELAGGAGLPHTVTATVARSLLAPARLTCRATHEASPVAFDVTDLQVLEA